MSGSLQKKIILSLAAGIALANVKTVGHQIKIIGELINEWRKINKYNLQRTINNLYKSKLVNIKYNSDETITLYLTEGGKEHQLRYKLENVKLNRQKNWDQKWRIVLFDIPDKFKKSRESLRWHLKKMRFFEYQESVFITPYPCLQEITFLIEFYKIKPFVRHIIATKLDNELHLKSHFGIS